MPAEFLGSGSPTPRYPKPPNQYEFFNGLTDGQILRHQKHAWAGTASLKEIAKVPRHGLEIVRDENATLLNGQR